MQQPSTPFRREPKSRINFAENQTLIQTGSKLHRHEGRMWFRCRKTPRWLRMHCTRRKRRRKRVKKMSQRPAVGQARRVSQKKLVHVGWQALGGYLPAEMAEYGHQGGDKERRLTFEHARSCLEGPLCVGKVVKCYRGKTRDGSWRKRLRYAAISEATVLNSFTLSRRISLIISFNPAR